MTKICKMKKFAQLVYIVRHFLFFGVPPPPRFVFRLFKSLLCYFDLFFKNHYIYYLYFFLALNLNKIKVMLLQNSYVAENQLKSTPSSQNKIITFDWVNFLATILPKFLLLVFASLIFLIKFYFLLILNTIN